jgi:hypothetical protein
MKILLKILKWLALIAGGLILIVVVINWKDEELSDGATALAKFHPPVLPNAQNAYLALVGFDAPAGSNPVTEGARIVAAHNAAVEARKSLPPAQRAEALESAAAKAGVSGANLQFRWSGKPFGDPLGLASLPQAMERGGEIADLQKLNAELFRRYLALQQMPAFADVSTPDIASVSLGNGVFNGPRMVLLSKAALDAQTHHEPAALAYFAADIAFWRRVLVGRGSLVDKMIAVRMLGADLREVADLLALPAFDAHAYAAPLRQILSPLTPVELDASPMFNREFGLNLNSLSATFAQARADSSVGLLEWFEHGPLSGRFLLKENATLNIVARDTLLLSTGSPAAYPKIRDALNDQAKAAFEPWKGSLYNPLGKVLVAVSAPSYLEYLARLCDLAAYQALVRAQLELRLANVAASDVSFYLVTAPAATKNPYTGYIFNWNPATRSLSFEPNSIRWREWGASVTLPPIPAPH